MGAGRGGETLTADHSGKGYVMAKITARGDSERRRWQGERGTLVLTVRGRLLRKLPGQGMSYTLEQTGVTVPQAEARALELGLEAGSRGGRVAPIASSR